MSTYELIQSIPIPTELDTLNVEAITPDGFYGSRNTDGFGGLLVSLNSEKTYPYTPYFSESLDIRVGEKCKIDSKNGLESISALLIQPKVEGMDKVISSFADIIVDYDFNSESNSRDLNDYLQKLIQLFTYTNQEDFPLSSAIGLWGELYLIKESPNIITFWKGSQGTTFDFQQKNMSLEVKSSVKGRSFQLDSKQLSSVDSSSYLVAISLEQNYEVGISVSDLVHQIINLLPGKDIFKFTIELLHRGFSIGNKKINLNKPFSLIYDNPIIIDLEEMNVEVTKYIGDCHSILEHGYFSKIKFSANYAQLKNLENFKYSDFGQILRGI